MTPRERVENILFGRGADKVPFTIYDNLMPRCTCERLLRNSGMCLVGSVNVVNTVQPNVKEWNEGYYENGQYKQRWFFETPYGTLTRVLVPGNGTTWHEKMPFSSPDDYKALLFMINDQVHTENYASFIAQDKEKGDDFLMRGHMGNEPMQELINNIMGTEAFCIEWMDNRDEVLKLYYALLEQCRKKYDMIACSPALYFNFGGNVSPEIIGVDRFRDYYAPVYNEAAEVLHKHNKLLGVHFDANNKLLSAEVAKTGLDYIEAFTPPPDCDMSVKEALEAWPDKVLWINFPSSIHLAETRTIKQTTRRILEEAAPGERLIIGITEDIPNKTYQRSLTAIAEVINSEGHLPLEV